MLVIIGTKLRKKNKRLESQAITRLRRPIPKKEPPPGSCRALADLPQISFVGEVAPRSTENDSLYLLLNFCLKLVFFRIFFYRVNDYIFRESYCVDMQSSKLWGNLVSFIVFSNKIEFFLGFQKKVVVAQNIKQLFLDIF